MATEYVPVGNGTSTDHPYPGLPFVDDTHLPLDDPAAIEEIGRLSGSDMWGRCDYGGRGEWIALTTDPKNHTLCWCVLHHPQLGRSVLLYRDSDLASVHDQFWNDTPRLFLRRAGGYGWDGTTWYRPRQVIDWSHERYDLRPAAHPTSITAADLVDSTADPAHGQVHRVARFEPHTVPDQQWRHDLARWAYHRTTHDRPLGGCLVTVNAPELDELLTTDEVAELAGIAASTLRSYITRDQSEIPTPQDNRGGRPLWAKRVIEDWMERRKRNDVGNLLVSGDPDGSAPKPSLRAAWDEMTWQLRQVLQRPGTPLKRRADRGEVASELGWVAALISEKLLPRKRVLHSTLEFTLLWDLYESTGHREEPIAGRYALNPDTEQLLGWYIRHNPDGTPMLFGAVIREAEEKLDIPKDVTTKTLRQAAKAALADDEFDHVRDYLDHALPPSNRSS